MNYCENCCSENITYYRSTASSDWYYCIDCGHDSSFLSKRGK
jgi:hypothetical protein